MDERTSKYNFSNAIDKFFKLGRDLNQRDTKAVKKQLVDY